MKNSLMCNEYKFTLAHIDKNIINLDNSFEESEISEQNEVNDSE